MNDERVKNEKECGGVHYQDQNIKEMKIKETKNGGHQWKGQKVE